MEEIAAFGHDSGSLKFNLKFGYVYFKKLIDELIIRKTQGVCKQFLWIRKSSCTYHDEKNLKEMAAFVL